MMIVFLEAGYMKRIVLSFIVIISILSLKAQTALLPYQNPTLKAEQRADDLVQCMLDIDIGLRRLV